MSQTIIQLGIDIENIKTKSTLSDAFVEASVILNLEKGLKIISDALE